MLNGTGALFIADPDLDLLSHKSLGFLRGQIDNAGLYLKDTETIDAGTLTGNTAHFVAVHQTVGMICALGLRRSNRSGGRRDR